MEIKFCNKCDKEVECEEQEVVFRGTDKSYIGYFCPICDTEFENKGDEYEDE